MSAAPTRLSLAPLAHHWPREKVLAFYEGIEGLPLAVVYLGEIICNKRSSMGLRDWLGVASRLSGAGKQVVLSTKTIVDSHAELRMLDRVLALGRVAVEVNDFGLIGRLPPGGFVAGMHLNAFNPRALQMLASCGASRWVAPPEMDRVALLAALEALPPRMETEVMVYGRLPLAFSTRCYTAKSHGRSRRDCEDCCLEHPEGQRLASLDGEGLMVVNGPQTLSEPVFNLMGAVGQLARLGVSLLRLDLPQASHAAATVRLFDAALRGEIDEKAALAQLSALAPARFCNGYWLGKAGIKYVPLV